MDFWGLFQESVVSLSQFSICNLLINPGPVWVTCFNPAALGRRGPAQACGSISAVISLEAAVTQSLACL